MLAASAIRASFRAVRTSSSLFRRAASSDAAAVALLRSVFAAHGHERAMIDPLGMVTARGDGGKAVDKTIALLEDSNVADHVAHFESVYGFGSTIGCEVAHCTHLEEREWLESRMEHGWGARLAREDGSALDAAGRPIKALGRLRQAHALMLQGEAWEHFLATKFPQLKRYSGEGAESMLPALDAMFESAAMVGAGEVVIGMPHRGRLSLLVSLLNYPARKLFRKLKGLPDIPSGVQGLDDVSSHVAASTLRKYGTQSVRVSLLHNPSHLEAVNPVAMGKVRAKRVGAGARSPPVEGAPAPLPTTRTAASGPMAGSPDSMCLLIHGDGAVSGQGVVAESLAMARIPGFSVGGTVHLVVNNQVAFTAGSSEGRSSLYCTDFAKSIGAPVLHVNGEDIHAVLWAAKTATEFRAKFGHDIVVDLVTYRRHGHNELDQPSFTQPSMYRNISSRQTLPSRFATDLVGAGHLQQDKDKEIRQKLSSHLQAELDAAETFSFDTGSFGEPTDASVKTTGSLVVADGSAFAGKWTGMRLAQPAEVPGSISSTGVDPKVLLQVGRASVTVPDDIRVHGHLERNHVKSRMEALDAALLDHDAPVINWATAEALAFGSLLNEGFDVRLSGQDAQRGTFSHRHAALTCQESEKKVIPLNYIREGQGKFEVVSSNLSEFAVLGYEIGHSMESPGHLVLWEAQFGDFANGAQIAIDTFLSGTESKWLRQTGLVMLLPHGFDGAGPEHSSSRVERYLQLVNSPAWAAGGVDAPVEGTSEAVTAARDGFGAWEAPPTHAHAMASASFDAVKGWKADKSWLESPNMSVCQPSTSANYFHLLRRQLHRPFRKPLIIVAPKILLRLKAAQSSLNDMVSGTRFQSVIGDSSVSDAKEVLLCSGNMYYDLVSARKAAGKDGSTAIVRIEELAPFPATALATELSKHSKATRVAWVQEEPANAGAWTFLSRHMNPVVKGTVSGARGVELVARPSIATPAVGVSSMHKQQDVALFEAALSGRQ
jgi:probable 2-oxoglutarate dehydrogenase E1 component DHKTD1